MGMWQYIEIYVNILKIQKYIENIALVFCLWICFTSRSMRRIRGVRLPLTLVSASWLLKMTTRKPGTPE